MEDEFHLVMECPKYNGFREHMLQQLKEIFVDLQDLDEPCLFRFILGSEAYEANIILEQYLDKVTGMRGNV